MLKNAWFFKQKKTKMNEECHSYIFIVKRGQTASYFKGRFM